MTEDDYDRLALEGELAALEFKVPGDGTGTGIQDLVLALLDRFYAMPCSSGEHGPAMRIRQQWAAHKAKNKDAKVITAWDDEGLLFIASGIEALMVALNGCYSVLWVELLLRKGGPDAEERTRH